MSRESQPLASREILESALRAVTADTADVADVADHWQVFGVRARHVEFWQADAGRAHHRLAYDRTRDGWVHGLLWP